ncbi:MAG: trehalose-phosphatase [Myxococcota bacterium]
MPVLPDALEHWDALQARLQGAPVAVFLDYDGTLTPIQARPQDAIMDPSMREAVQHLAAQHFVAIVTGRGLDDARALVGIPTLAYATNHGLEIEGPDFRFEPDPTLRPTFASLRERVDALVAGVEGVVVEHKGLSIAIHVRLVDPAAAAQIEAGIDEIIAEHPSLRKGTGKKVFELRPTLDWHKGAAVRWLSERLATTTGGTAPVALFIGDDLTDEDALAQVHEHGVGIFVGQPQWDTAARYGLADPAAVEVFLRRLVGRG